MYYDNRVSAGQVLVPLLTKYSKKEDVVVLGLPRGGVITAAQVAKGLNAPLDVIVLRKVGAPHNPELAIGAVNDQGEGFFNTPLIEYLGLNDTYIEQAVAKEKARAQTRLGEYRKIHPKVSLENKTVIIVDDGLATGATMKAAVQAVKAEGALKIVVAVPVGSPDSVFELKELADEVICAETPLLFQAVGQFYEDFSEVSDEEVIDILKAEG